MKLTHRQYDYDRLLAKASQLLGLPAQTFSLEWELEKMLRRRAKLVERRGLREAFPRVEICGGRNGKELEIGIEVFQLKPKSPEPLPVVHIRCYWPCNSGDPWYDFWAVPEARFDEAYRLFRRWDRQSIHQPEPIMHAADSKRFIDNTLGFLKHNVATLRKYGIPQRRGVLLTGKPGNGKTMASRWLRYLCSLQKLEFRSVSAEEYEAAKNESCARHLFSLPTPGIIQFDDFDIYLRDRSKNQATIDHTTFLTELDGIGNRHGVVYLFTTNCTLEELDSAFLRPGRIDQVIEFTTPDASLRKQFIESSWHADIRDSLDISQAVIDTAGKSFAEMDELKKLFVLHFLEHGEWNWQLALDAASLGRTAEEPNRIGFQRTKGSQLNGKRLKESLPAISAKQ